MRIISGIAKGKKILIPTDNKTRPLKDMVKESIFNILNHSNLLNSKLNESIVLDLFSGVGSFGLEAISRGAKKVVFFENYKAAKNLLIENLTNLNFLKKAEVYQKNIYNKNILEKLNYKFNLVFIDPPFKDDNIKELINNLSDSKMIESKTLVIMHRNKISKDDFGYKFKNIRTEIYGSSKIIYGYFNV